MVLSKVELDVIGLYDVYRGRCIVVGPVTSDQTYGFQRPGANYQVVQWLWRNGTNLVSEDGTKATFSDRKAIEALQWYAEHRSRKAE